MLVDYAALYDDILDHENDRVNVTVDYALMSSSLKGPYVVKYLRTHCDRYNKTKQQTERTFLARIAASAELRSVCQSLAPEEVIDSIVAELRALARKRGSMQSLLDTDDFALRLTVSANLALDQFVELRQVLDQKQQVSVWTKVVIHQLIANALRLLHANGMYQGDMHTRNVLYKVVRGVAHIRIIDFDFGYDIPQASRGMPLGGDTVMAQRKKYTISYSYPNYMYTDATRLYVTKAVPNLTSTQHEDRKWFMVTAKEISELRGLLPSPETKLVDLDTVIGNVHDWRECDTGVWPSSVRGVTTFMRYDDAGYTWVLRVVDTLDDDYDDEMFAHEICSALAQPASSPIRGISVQIKTLDKLRERFGLIDVIPLDLVHRCVLVLRVVGRVRPHEKHGTSLLIADMARSFPTRKAFPNSAARAQFETVYAQPLRARLRLIDARRTVVRLWNDVHADKVGSKRKRTYEK